MNIENVEGSPMNDTLILSNYNNLIYASYGNDIMNG